MAGESEIQALRARIEALELTTAFQERTIGQLDQVVQTFIERVEHLERALDHVRVAVDALPIGPQCDPPPHS